MCGIAGFLVQRPNSRLDPQCMNRVLSKIAHRGPDGAGIWETSGGQLILGHKRLSIVDLSSKANQPMLCADQYAIVFNGEIYNHRLLRKELEEDGVEFKTDHSDTEVLLNGYIHWGLSTLLSKVNGMFAFALFDVKKNKLTLVRDRIGIKCLYYSVFQKQVVFCSEIKGILEAGLFAPELNRSHLNEYLLNRSLAAPNTLFKHVHKMKPASYLEIDLGTLNVRESRYWNPLAREPNQTIKKQAELESELKSLFSSSVDFRLESDVPVGLFLSGGVDSNYVLSQLAEKREDINCFTASYPTESRYDESAVARQTAKKFNARYIDVPVESDNYLDILEQVVYFQEEPISAPICVPVYFLAQAARRHEVPVVLAGEGADEILIGYSNWVKFRKAQGIVHSWPFVRSMSSIAYRIFGLSPRNPLSPVHDVLGRASAGYPLFWGGAMDMNGATRASLLDDGRQASQLNAELYESQIKPRLQDFKQHRSPSSISAWMTYLDLNHRLPELMLPRLDKMGMAHSVEGRVPFLDHRLVELILAVPESVMCEKPSIGKAALKSLAANKLGADFVYRDKRGFQAPVAEWKDGRFGELTRILELFAERTSIFSSGAVGMVLKQGGRRYFTLLNFMLWYLIYIDNVMADKLPDLKNWREY